MAATRVGIALEQDLVAGIEEHQLRIEPQGADRRQPFRQAGEVAAVAHVDADCKLFRRAELFR